ncbi:MAG: polysaccharide deacetylase family protein [Brumimicrobium sp.]
MNINVYIPNTFIEERKYTLKVLFAYFKGVSIDIHSSDETKNYTFEFPGGKKLIIEDAFWSRLTRNDTYTEKTPKPTLAESYELKIAEESLKFISLYGSPEYNFDNQQNLTIHSDFIASSFFMLSRWEEYVSNSKDEHGRFPDNESFAVQNGFNERPIVNEYIEILKSIIEFFENTKIDYNRNYEVFVTHDVDEIFYLSPFKNFIRALAINLVYDKSLKLFFKTITNWWASISNKNKDPFHTFDYLMDISEKNGLTSYFYFIPGKKGEVDFRYSIDKKYVRKIIDNIVKRNHIVGIHPSYSTFKNQKQLNTELQRLKSVCVNQEITEGRQHFLRFSLPETLQDWNTIGLQTDSSLGYSKNIGFRCGICYTFPVFDIEKRKELNLLERPLTVMEVALKKKIQDIDSFNSDVIKLAKIVKHYQGDFVLLWHNSNLSINPWKVLGMNYSTLIKKIK